MKTNRIIKLFCLCCLFLTNVVVHAQSEDNQVLIFRNTGETNLLYQSEIDSIMFTKIDTLGIEYDEPIAQVFYTADTTLYVSIAEIDSVCFGSRNEIEYRTDVRVLEDNPDMQWIIRYDGYNIYYKTSTPNNVLPVVGQKLYFTEQTEMFPCGLCARVDKVVREGSEIAVAVSDVEYTDIFSKFFYAGSLGGVQNEVNKSKASRAIPIDKTFRLNLFLGFDNVGKISLEGTLDVKGKVVMNPFKEYYNAEIDLIKTYGGLINVNLKEKQVFKREENIVHFPLPLVAGVLHPSIDVGLFIDVNAEITFDFGYSQKSTTHVSWTKRKDEQTFPKPISTDDGVQTNEAKTQITLDGSAFFGAKMNVNFDLVGKVIGARAKIKVGRALEGNLTLGALAELSKGYNAEAYANVNAWDMQRIQFEGCSTRRNKWIWGNPIETRFFYFGFSWGNKLLELFPKFFAHRAVVSPSNKDVTVAVKSNNEIAHNVETGFQIVKSEKEPEPLKTVFVKEIEATPTEEVQGVDAEINIPQDAITNDSVFVRPIIKYAGYTIPHATICAAQDPYIQPIIFNMSNGAATVTSGVPVIDNARVDSTLYNSGPFVVLIEKNDTVYHEVSPYAGIGENYGYIYYEDSQDLTGHWEGKVDDDNISIIFGNNITCECEFKCNDLSFTDGKYILNEPQAGYILIESGDDNILIEILSMSKDSMDVKLKNGIHKGKNCKLTRK